MALKKFYLDKRVQVDKTSSYVNLENRLDLNAHIEKVVEVSDGFDSVKIDSITEKTADNGVDIESVHLEDRVISGDYKDFVTVTGATALTAADSGKTVLLASASGAAVTLPSAVAGMYYDFVTLTTLTSGSYTITAGAADLLIGGLLLVDDTTPEAAAIFKPDVSDDLIITLNGTTTGGEIGTAFRLTAISASRWMVEGVSAANGTLATPFS